MHTLLHFRPDNEGIFLKEKITAKTFSLCPDRESRCFGSTTVHTIATALNNTTIDRKSTHDVVSISSAYSNNYIEVVQDGSDHNLSLNLHYSNYNDNQ